MHKKWVAPILPYLAVWAGSFLLKSAWLSLIGFHCAILLTLAITRPEIPVRILVQGGSLKWLLANLLLCGISGIGLYFLWDRFGMAGDLPAQLRAVGLTPSSWPWFIAYFTLVNPFIEEYFWRAYLGSGTQGFYIGDLIFAGYHGLIMAGKVHVPAIIFALTCLTFIGWFWRQTRRAESGLLAPVVGHMAADLSILVCVMLKAGAG